MGAKLYLSNEMPDDVRSVDSILTFKSKLDSDLVSSFLITG